MTITLAMQLASLGLFGSLVTHAAAPVVEESPLEAISIQEIGRRASENVGLLKAQSDEIRASKLEADGARLLPNPSLAVQLGSLTSGGSSGTTIEATFTQIIPFPGKLGAHARVKDHVAKIVESTVEQSRVLVQHAAILRAFQWVILDEEAKHFREREKSFRLIREFFKNRPIVSPSARAESYLIERQIELLEKRFVELEQDKNSIELELRYLLQSPRRIHPQAQWIDPNTLPERGGSDDVARTPEFKRKELEVNQAEEALNRASLQAFPDISLGLGYRNEAVSPANHFYYGAIGLTIPLFDRGQYAEPAARAKLDAERARRDLLRFQISEHIENAWSRLLSAKEIATKFDFKRIATIDAWYSEVEREFRKGRISTAVLLQTDAQLHESVAAIYDAQMTLVQRLAELKALFGEPISWK